MNLLNDGAYLSAFLLGLLGSVHCLGMCGGIAGALAFAQTNPSPWRKILYPLCYAIGRLISYGFIGALAGLLGFKLIQHTHAGLLRGIAGVLMILMGISISGLASSLSRIEALGGIVWRKLNPLTRSIFPINSIWKALLMGLIWGWLPCGLVYSTLSLAVAQGAWQQAMLLMICFGLGTFPAIFASGLLAQKLARWTRTKELRYVAGFTVMGFGCWTLFLVLRHSMHSMHMM